jgi:hypothetical protein
MEGGTAAAAKRAARKMASPHACRHQIVFLPNRRNWAQAGTTWFEAAAS